VRVLLRAPAESDRAEFLAAMRASQELHEPWISAIATDEYFDRLLSRVSDERHDTSLVCLSDGGAIVGVINLTEIVRGAFQSAFLSYAAVSGYEGQGLMSDGLQLLLERAFVDLELHRLEANIQPGNGPSLAFVRRAGFICEGSSRAYLKLGGEWRDHEHWVMLAEEWRAGHARA
jgi:ribosomal-protein-alanine N-acetyltransferase